MTLLHCVDTVITTTWHLYTMLLLTLYRFMKLVHFVVIIDMWHCTICYHYHYRYMAGVHYCVSQYRYMLLVHFVVSVTTYKRHLYILLLLSIHVNLNTLLSMYLQVHDACSLFCLCHKCLCHYRYMTLVYFVVHVHDKCRFCCLFHLR